MKKYMLLIVVLLLVITSVSAREIKGVVTSKMDIPNHSNGGDDTETTVESHSSGSGSHCSRYEMVYVNHQPTPKCVQKESEIDLRCRNWMAGGNFCPA